MRSNAFALALDRFDMPFEGDDLSLDVGLFVEFMMANARPPESRA